MSLVTSSGVGGKDPQTKIKNKKTQQQTQPQTKIP